MKLLTNLDFLCFYLTGTKKEVGYYDFNANTVDVLPLADKDVSDMVFLHDFKPLAIKYNDGKFYWVETKYYEPVAETVYCYDVASHKRSTVYESDGVTWVYTYEPTSKGLYMKLYSVELVDDDGTNPCRYAPGEGDLLFYDGEKMTTVAEDVYDFKLDEDGTPLVQETENGDWEELPEP